MSGKEESGTPLSRVEESKVVGVEEVDMVRCFNVTTKGGLEYLAQYIPPFDKQYIKVTYPYLGGEVDEPIHGMIKKAVLKYIGEKARQ